MSDQSTQGGIGVLGLLGVLFVGLKLTGYIKWSWWLVLAPFWGGFALALAILGLLGGAALLAYLLDRSSRKSVNQWRR